MHRESARDTVAAATGLTSQASALPSALRASVLMGPKLGPAHDCKAVVPCAGPTRKGPWSDGCVATSGRAAGPRGGASAMHLAQALRRVLVGDGLWTSCGGWQLSAYSMTFTLPSGAERDVRTAIARFVPFFERWLRGGGCLLVLDRAPTNGAWHVHALAMLPVDFDASRLVMPGSLSGAPAQPSSVTKASSIPSASSRQRRACRWCGDALPVGARRDARAHDTCRRLVSRALRRLEREFGSRVRKSAERYARGGRTLRMAIREVARRNTIAEAMGVSVRRVPARDGCCACGNPLAARLTAKTCGHAYCRTRRWRKKHAPRITGRELLETLFDWFGPDESFSSAEALRIAHVFEFSCSRLRSLVKKVVRVQVLEHFGAQHAYRFLRDPTVVRRVPSVGLRALSSVAPVPMPPRRAQKPRVLGICAVATEASLTSRARASQIRSHAWRCLAYRQGVVTSRKCAIRWT
jgi:hypothetical protein